MHRNGNWKAEYQYDSSTGTLTGSIDLEVHYYEDGNVRLTTQLKLNDCADSSANVVQQIRAFESTSQQQINTAVSHMNEGPFKSLRRQLPVTKQKLEWEKIASYSIGPGRQ